MQAIILTGGNGALLRPLTFSTPKPLLPLLNQPILQYIIRLLIQHQATEVIVAANYRSELVFSWIDQQEWPVPVRTHSVDEYRGSAQVLWDLRDQLADQFLVIFADTLVDLPLGSIFESFAKSGDLGWLGLSASSDPFSAAFVQVTDEKATAIGNDSKWTATDGRFYFLTRKSIIQNAEHSSNIFPELFQSLIGQTGGVPVVPSTGYWAVLGRLEPYLEANFTLLSQLGISYIDPKTTVPDTATIVGPVFIGPDCQIGAHCTIGPNVVMGPNVAIGESAIVRNSMILASANIGAEVNVAQSIIGFSAIIGARTQVAPLCIIGAFTDIGDDCTVSSGSRVGPSLVVPDHTRVSDILFPPNPMSDDLAKNSSKVAMQNGLAGIEFDVFRIISLTGDVTLHQIQNRLDLPNESLLAIVNSLVNRSIVIATENPTTAVTSYSARPQI